MTILRGIPIVFTPDEVIRAQKRGGRHPGHPPRPWLVEAAEQAIAMSRELIVPAAVYGEFSVEMVMDERVSLSAAAGGVEELHVGPKVELLAPAQRVLVAVYTLGPALEARVHALHIAGEDLLAFMLDSVGVLALGTVGERLRELAEARAQELGWGVGPALSPGSLAGWPLQGQRQVCRLLPLDEIGVRLTEYCVLEPHKSVSLVVGLGPDYGSGHVGSMCHYCCLADRCWRRREAGQGESL